MGWRITQFVSDLIKKMMYYKALFSVLVLAVLAQTTFGIVYPIIYKPLIDNIGKPEGLTVIISALIFLVSLWVVYTLFNIAGHKASCRLALKISSKIRREIFLKIDSIEEQKLKQYGKLKIASFMGSDFDFFELAVANSVVPMMQNLLEIIIGILVMFYFSWRLSLLYILLMPVQLIISIKLTRVSNENAKDSHVSTGELVGITSEVCRFSRSVNVYNSFEIFLNKFSKSLNDYKRKKEGLFFNSGLIPIVSTSISQFSLLCVLFIGSVMAAQRHITPGVLVSFIMLCRGAMLAINVVLYEWSGVVKAMTTYNKVNDFLSESIEPTGDVEVDLASPFYCQIDSLYFRFTKESSLLFDNLSLSLERGKSYFIVGASGSGKSTLLTIIMGLAMKYRGDVLLFGKDIKQLNRSKMIANIAYVSQTPFLFRGTILENVCLSNPSVNYDTVKQVMKSLNMHDFVESLPLGYQTKIGEGGQALSGGQSQKIEIARALISDREIILLDEPTSSLDNLSYHQISSVLRKEMKEKMVIQVTHDLDTIQPNDNVVMIGDGRVIESGSHAFLMGNDGRYADLMKGYELTKVSEKGDFEISLKFIRNIPFLAFFSDSELRNIIKKFVIEEYSQGEFVFRQGDPGDRLYIIARGEVEVIKEVGSNSRTVTSLCSGVGGFFGEIALALDLARTASIKVKKNCLLLTLNKLHLQEVIEKNPLLGEKLKSLAKTRLNATNNLRP